MRKIHCPHCGHDVSMDDYRVELDGRTLQQGGCESIEWVETCPSCGRVYTVDVSVGPVDVSVRA